MTRFSEQGVVDPDEVHRHLREKGMIAAIKYYRHQTGAGLKEAKEAVEALDAQQRGLPVVRSTEYQQGTIDHDKLHRILREQGKIPAIKYYRQCTGVGLKEAKDAVEYIARQDRL
jgi:ribosomal protein L7/L12